MTKLDTAAPTTSPNARGDPAMNAMQSTQTRRPRTRQLAALASLVVLLLALATGAALRQAVTARPASRAPAAPALAHDGYAPTGLDYREDHRSDTLAANATQSAAPCPGRDLAVTGACGAAGSAAPQSPAVVPAQRQRPAALDALFYGPAAARTPDQARQQQQPARLDATFYGPAAPTAPAADPRAAQQRQRPAWLDARDYGPAAGGAAPFCNGDGAVSSNACNIP